VYGGRSRYRRISFRFHELGSSGLLQPAFAIVYGDRHQAPHIAEQYHLMRLFQASCLWSSFGFSPSIFGKIGEIAHEIGIG
jgi:hypothetical protein